MRLSFITPIFCCLFFIVFSAKSQQSERDSTFELILQADNLEDKVYHKQSLFYILININQDTALVS